MWLCFAFFIQFLIFLTITCWFVHLSICLQLLQRRQELLWTRGSLRLPAKLLPEDGRVILMIQKPSRDTATISNDHLVSISAALVAVYRCLWGYRWRQDVDGTSSNGLITTNKRYPHRGFRPKVVEDDRPRFGGLKQWESPSWWELSQWKICYGVWKGLPAQETLPGLPFDCDIWMRALCTRHCWIQRCHHDEVWGPPVIKRSLWKGIAIWIICSTISWCQTANLSLDHDIQNVWFEKSSLHSLDYDESQREVHSTKSLCLAA